MARPGVMSSAERKISITRTFEDFPVTTSVWGKMTVFSPADPVMDFDGTSDLDVVAGVDEEAVGNGGLMPCGELGGTEAGFLLHEMCRHQIAVRNERLGERQADRHPLGRLDSE